jgi:predicted nucleic acid-binding protein
VALARDDQLGPDSKRQPGVPEGKVSKHVVQQGLSRHSAGLLDLDAAIAKLAAALGASPRLPLANSILLATAREHDAVVGAQDADFQELDGVKYAAAR